jgi:hypothetical protein
VGPFKNQEGGQYLIQQYCRSAPLNPVILPPWSVSARIAQAKHPPSRSYECIVRHVPSNEPNEQLPPPLKHLSMSHFFAGHRSRVVLHGWACKHAVRNSTTS